METILKETGNELERNGVKFYQTETENFTWDRN